MSLEWTIIWNQVAGDDVILDETIRQQEISDILCHITFWMRGKVSHKFESINCDRSTNWQQPTEAGTHRHTYKRPIFHQKGHVGILCTTTLYWPCCIHHEVLLEQAYIQSLYEKRKKMIDWIYGCFHRTMNEFPDFSCVRDLNFVKNNLLGALQNANA